MARYRKIDVRMWLDGKFRKLSAPRPNARDCWIYLLTNPETTNIPGLYRAFEETLARGLGWSLRGFRRAYAELSAQGMVQADWDAGLVFIPNVIKYDPPTNQNVIKSWVDTLDELPECPLKVEACLQIDRSLRGSAEWYAEAFPQGFWKAMPTPEPDPEPEQEPEEAKASAPASPSLDGPKQVELVVEEPKRESKRAKADPAAVQSVIGEYSRVWVETRQPTDGKPPTLAEADRFQAAKLIRDHGLESALEFVRQYLDDPDRWLSEQGHPLRLITSRINGYRARAAPKRRFAFQEPCGPFAETREERL